MNHIIKRRGDNLPFFTVIIVDSRSHEFPKWVEKAVFSVTNQTIEDLEMICIDNRDKAYSIGKCFNEGLRLATGKWVYFLGDDDYISFDYLASLKNYIENFTNENTVVASTYCTFFSDSGDEVEPKDKIVMGAFLKSYVGDNYFNEDLKQWIDVNAFQKCLDDKKNIKVCRYHYGYFYRQHYNNISGRKVIDKDKYIDYVPEGDLGKDFYIVDSIGSFTKEIKHHFDAVRSREFMPRLAKDSKIIWCEWGDHNAKAIANWGGTQLKILRLHGYEFYNGNLDDINLSGFDYIIVNSERLKRKLIGKTLRYNNIVVIPVGVDIDKFDLADKKDYNKIAYAGFLSRTKNTGLLLFLAKELPDYEFHLKGKFQEPDFEEWFLANKTDNIFLHDWGNDVNNFFQDKGYVISPAHRETFHVTLAEGMATGCTPLIYNWVGADSIYSSDWIFNSLDELKNMLNELPQPAMDMREFISKYDIKYTLEKIQNLVGSYDSSRNVSKTSDIVR